MTWSETSPDQFTDGVYEVAKSVVGNLTHLIIIRCDGVQIRDWREAWRIKQELVSDCEVVELYPHDAEIHIWCFTDPEYRLPYGYAHRLLRDPLDRAEGMRLRP